MPTTVPQTYIPPPLPPALPSGQMPLPITRTISLSAPFKWLARGAQDLRQGGWWSLCHGLVLAVLGGLLLFLAHDRFWIIAGAFSGFLVVAPVLATSLYAMSRAIERGEDINLQLIVKTWTRWQYSRYAAEGGYWCLVRFGLLLALAGTGWVLTSAALITLMTPQPVHTPMDFLRHVVMSPHHYLFELWLTLGGLMAAPLFASSVIAMPLLLDRRVNVMQAVLASWQAVLHNPVPLAWWATLIMLFTLAGLSTFLVGLVPLLPLLGHASWHAYRDLTDVSGLPERFPPEGST